MKSDSGGRFSEGKKERDKGRERARQLKKQDKMKEW